MMIQQIRFYIIAEKENGEYNELGGLMVTNYSGEHFVFCGECGECFADDEIIILEKYNNWVSLSDTIIGT